MKSINVDAPVVLVCGGRNYKDRRNVFDVLDRIRKEFGGTIIVLHGAQRGADLLAEDWAKNREQAYFGVHAEWLKYDLEAGSRRNKRMAYVFCPDLVVAFPGGTGTSNMVALAEKNRIEVVIA